MAQVRIRIANQWFRYVEPDTLRRDIANAQVALRQRRAAVLRDERRIEAMEAGVVELERQLAVERERAAARKAERKASARG